MNKYNVLLAAMRTIKNPQDYLLDYLGMKQGNFYYKMRDGSKYIVRGMTNDRNIFNEVLIHKIYNPPGFEIKKGDIVMDIGAHIGTFSIFASQYAKAVYSFEPVPENFHLLQENIQANQKSNIISVNKAVSLASGKRDLFIDKENRGGHSFYSDSDKKSANIVAQTVSLTDFFAEQKIAKIDFLKIDCEGGEYDILFGCPKSALNIIDKISMEYHPIDQARNARTLKAFLESNGFSVNLVESMNLLYAARKS